MGRVKTQVVVIFFLLVASVPTIFAQQPQAFLDLRDSMTSRSRATVDGGNLNKLRKAVMDGNIYNVADKLAQKQVVQPALEALSYTHSHIADRCDGNLRAHHVTNVFAHTLDGELYRDLMAARNSLDDISEYPYNTSCSEVVRCYFEDEIIKAGGDPDQWDVYTDKTNWSCRDIVSTIYRTMYVQTSTLETMKNVNYADEIFANGDKDDAPYDLLLDVEEIANILFTHNEQPSEIRFYEMQAFDDYYKNDPDDTEEYEYEHAEDQEQYDRLEQSSGVTPVIPDEEESTYVPSQEPPVGRVDHAGNAGGSTNTSGGSSGGSAPITPNPGGSMGGDPDGGPINNEICETPIPEIPESDTTLEDAEAEQEYTYLRNRKFELDVLTSVALGSMMTAQDQELFGDDDFSNDPQRDEAVQTAEGIIDEMFDLEGDTLQEFEDHVKGCVEEFTENDPKQRRKILRKSVTQPSLFTKCVMGGMCKEIGDPSGRGMFRIKICKEPRKGYGINSSQPVSSVEEIMDELNNVCSTMKNGGQLIKHNKTKDHWEHKLMNLNLGKSFSFGLTVTFKPSPAKEDPAAIKRLQIENNKYLQKLLLGSTDKLTFQDQRNKYIIIENPIRTSALKEADLIQDADIKATLYAESIDREKQIKERETMSQLGHYADMHEVFIDFVDQNILYRQFANEHTQSLLDTSSATFKKFQGNK